MSDHYCCKGCGQRECVCKPDPQPHFAYASLWPKDPVKDPKPPDESLEDRIKGTARAAVDVELNDLFNQFLSDLSKMGLFEPRNVMLIQSNTLGRTLELMHTTIAPMITETRTRRALDRVMRDENVRKAIDAAVRSI